MQNNKKEKMLRLKKFLIYIHGEVLGQKKYKFYCSSNNLKVLIFKYGKEEGVKKHNEFKKNSSFSKTIDSYILKYGKEEGEKKYFEKNKKLSVGYNSLKERGYSEDEIKFIKNKHSKNSTVNLETLTEKLGEEEALKKIKSIKENSFSCWKKDDWIKRGYSEKESIEKVIRSQSRGIEWFKDKYGIEADEKFLKYNKSRGRSKQQLIEKFGLEKTNEILKKRSPNYKALVEIHGEKKAKEILIKKCSAFNKTGFSKIQVEFATSLYNLLPKNIASDFIGIPITQTYTMFLEKEEINLIDQRVIIPDIKIKNIIIEFDGDYWHKFTIEKDLLKDKICKNRNLEVLRIKESEYKKNKELLLSDLVEKIIKIYEN